MTNDLTLPLKKALVEHISSSALVLDLVPYASIYSQTTDAKCAWPFIRLGTIITLPYEATCWSGIEARVTWHAFAETNDEYAAEDYVLEISAAISTAMKSFRPAGLGIISNQFLQAYSMRDEPEADKWHSLTEFRLQLHS